MGRWLASELPDSVTGFSGIEGSGGNSSLGPLSKINKIDICDMVDFENERQWFSEAGDSGLTG